MRLMLRIAMCLLAAGCVKVKVQQWDQVERPVREPESVAVLSAEPEEPYTVIAVIESSFEGALKGYDDLRQELIVQAADLGGDAVILGPESKKSGVIFVTTPSVTTPIFFDKKKLTGRVIAFNGT